MNKEFEHNYESVDEPEIAQQHAIYRDWNAIADVQKKLQQPGKEECEDCGDSIPLERRKAAPWSIRCLPCQEIHEFNLKLKG